MTQVPPRRVTRTRDWKKAPVHPRPSEPVMVPNTPTASSTGEPARPRAAPGAAAAGDPGLAGLVELACRAPSVANSQPWAWGVQPGVVWLEADDRRRLTDTDPDGRDLVISCGAALHHAQVAALALGWEPRVRRTGDVGPALARLDLAPAPPRAEGVAALLERTTDRRRFTSWPVPGERVAALAAAASSWGGRALPILDPLDRVRVQRLVAEAAAGGAGDPSVARARAQGELHPGDGLLLLAGDADDPGAWLVAGEALGAVYLAAARDGLTVVPLRSVVAAPATRERLRADVLGRRAEPLLLVRVGWRAVGRSDLPRTPRRPVADVLLS